MTLDKLKAKWCDLCIKMNTKGVPLPMLRDPKTCQASVSLTLVFISFNVWLAVIVAMAFKADLGLDVNATFNMFLATAGLYWGRKFQGDTKSLGEKSE